jgi:4-hydroxy-tetrahydrodipicolinate synthase
MFSGAIPALVTPFTASGKLNEAKVRELIQFHIEKGTPAVVPSGTTGESPNLSNQEKQRYFEIVVEAANGKIQVIAGTGGNNTEHSVKMTQIAQKIGVDAVLIVAPYYNQPTQEGLYQHYMKIADEGGLPVVIYNVPGRTSVNIFPDTVVRLCGHERIAAIKEALGNLGQISEIHRRCGDKLTILSGDDGLTLPVLSAGGKGVISVTANIIPDKINEMVVAFLNGNFQTALNLHHKYEPLHDAMFLETNPIPVKTAMNLMGMEVGGFRLPLCEMSEANQKKLETILRRYELVN